MNPELLKRCREYMGRHLQGVDTKTWKTLSTGKSGQFQIVLHHDDGKIQIVGSCAVEACTMVERFAKDSQHAVDVARALEKIIAADMNWPEPKKVDPSVPPKEGLDAPEADRVE